MCLRLSWFLGLAFKWHFRSLEITTNNTPSWVGCFITATDHFCSSFSNASDLTSPSNTKIPLKHWSHPKWPAFQGPQKGGCRLPDRDWEGTVLPSGSMGKGTRRRPCLDEHGGLYCHLKRHSCGVLGIGIHFPHSQLRTHARLFTDPPSI